MSRASVQCSGLVSQRVSWSDVILTFLWRHGVALKVFALVSGIEKKGEENVARGANLASGPRAVLFASKVAVRTGKWVYTLVGSSSDLGHCEALLPKVQQNPIKEPGFASLRFT